MSHRRHGRRAPYTVIGVRRLPCYRCGRRAEYQWNVCADAQVTGTFEVEKARLQRLFDARRLGGTLDGVPVGVERVERPWGSVPALVVVHARAPGRRVLLVVPDGVLDPPPPDAAVAAVPAPPDDPAAPDRRALLAYAADRFATGHLVVAGGVGTLHLLTARPGATLPARPLPGVSSVRARAVYRPICPDCDYLLNALVVRWIGMPDAEEKLRWYRTSYLGLDPIPVEG